MMTLKEAIDQFVLERVGAALADVIQKQRRNELLGESEKILTELPEDKRATIEAFIETINDQMAEEECLLYLAGFQDGIYIMEHLKNIAGGK